MAQSEQFSRFLFRAYKVQTYTVVSSAVYGATHHHQFALGIRLLHWPMTRHSCLLVVGCWYCSALSSPYCRRRCPQFLIDHFHGVVCWHFDLNKNTHHEYDYKTTWRRQTLRKVGGRLVVPLEGVVAGPS